MPTENAEKVKLRLVYEWNCPQCGCQNAREADPCVVIRQPRTVTCIRCENEWGVKSAN